MSTDDEDITREFWGIEPPSGGMRRPTAPRPAPQRRGLSDVLDPMLGRNLAIVGVALLGLGGLSAFAGQADEPGGDTAEVIVALAPDSVPPSTTPLEPATTAAPETSPAPATTSVPATTAAPAPATTAAPAPTTTAAPATTQATEARMASAERCALEYRVHAGDYWIRIADAAGIGLRDLLAANDATTDSLLLPGDEVCLPAGASMPAPPPSTTTAAPTTTAPTTAAPTTAATTAPTTAPPTTAPSSAPAGDVEAIIREVFPASEHETALRVAWRESNYRPEVYNGHCCYGVFQIYWQVHRGWLANHGVTDSSQLLDARTNIEMAYLLFQRAGGWGPWRQTAY